MNMRDIIILGVCVALGAAGYLLVGSPGMGGEPIKAREAALAARIQAAPETLKPAEALSLLQARVKAAPQEAAPHFFIGNMMRQQGRLEDAMRAYQSALRRDEAYVEAMVALADVLVEARGDGTITKDAMRLYGRAYALDPQSTDAGFLAGLGAWQAGDTETARQAWAVILDGLAADNPDRQKFEAMITRIEE